MPRAGSRARRHVPRRTTKLRVVSGPSSRITQRLVGSPNDSIAVLTVPTYERAPHMVKEDNLAIADRHDASRGSRASRPHMQHHCS
jgi:hypothetical protein